MTIYERFQVWAVRNDTYERDDTSSVLAYYDSYGKAQERAVGKGWFGATARITKHEALRVGNNVWLLAKDTPIDVTQDESISDDDLREQTLATLSANQKRVLGLEW